MQLMKIRLEHFKKFKELERNFGPGINVVRGPLNEIGKSTLLDGIVAALFDNPKSTSKELENYIAWGSSHRPKISIHFEVESKAYLLEKDFESKTLRLSELDTGEEWRTLKEVSEKICEFLGTDSPSLFLSTSCIRQDEIRDISSGKKQISESLEGIVTGGAEEAVASRVIEKLDKQISAMTKGMERLTKSPGRIAYLSKQVSDLRQQLITISREVADVEQSKIELVEVTDELKQNEAQLSEAGSLLEKNKRRMEVEQKIEKLEKEYDAVEATVRDIKTLLVQIQGYESGLAMIAGFDDVDKVLDVHERLEHLEASRNNITIDLPKRRDELKAYDQELSKKKLVNLLASKICLALGAVIAVAGLLGTLYNITSLVAGIIGIALLIGSILAKSSQNHRRTQMSELQHRIDQMEGALKEIEDQKCNALLEVQCSSIEEFKQKEESHREILKKKVAAENQLVGKLGIQTLDQLERRQRLAARALAEEREKLTDDLKSTTLTPEQYVKYENIVKGLQKKNEQLNRRKLACEVGIERAQFSTEDQIKGEETLEALEDMLLREHRKVRILELTKDFISRARTETLVSANELLRTEIQRNFETFTDGKYDSVMIGEGSLDFHIYSKEKRDWARPEELSSGAIDEFYLACRLALVRLIYGDRKLPLILDDPFINFDGLRLARTLKFLDNLSRDHQIIIFTLGTIYDNIADKIIEFT
jgi:DNA repair exonuclease SbcCD ATPase subunit